jgi:glucoamylase
LAWRLKQANALGLLNPWTLFGGGSYLILNGPITGQERWEETSGYSPSTLASIIAALVCAAEFAAQRLDQGVSDFVLNYADWLSSHLEEWLVTSCGELVSGKPASLHPDHPGGPCSP